MPKKSVDVENQSVTFTFGDGGEAVARLADFSDEIVTQLALHGLSQKGGDSYAGAKSACAENDIDPEEWSKAQVEGVIRQLTDGEWTVRREGGGGGGVTDLARALAEATGSDLTDAVAKVNDADKDTKAALRKHPAIAAILARLRQERAAKKQAELESAAADAPALSDII